MLSWDKPNFWVRMAIMTLNVKVNDPHFQYQLWLFPNACLVILAQICDELSCGQDKYKDNKLELW